jgi:hypothetical protein
MVSDKGKPIGILLRYSMRFPSDDYFWQSPSVTPETDVSVGVWANGRVLHQEIEPPMAVGNSGERRYEKEKTYNFTTEFVPNFLILNPERTKLCILQPPTEYKAAFENLITSGARVRYKITINGTKYEGVTENSFEPRVYYESAKSEGATQLEGLGFGGSTSPCQ